MLCLRWKWSQAAGAIVVDAFLQKLEFIVVMTQAARLQKRRVLIMGEDAELAARLGTVFERAGAVVETARGIPTGESDGTLAAEAAVRELGGLDVLVNIGPGALPGDSPDPDQRSYEVERALTQFMGRLVTTTEAALAAMKAGASIINVVAMSVQTLTAAHQALAAAVVDTTQDWAAILMERGIRVNAVVGGPWLDPAVAAALDAPHDGQVTAESAQLDALVYLASTNSSHISGSVVSVARPIEATTTARTGEAPTDL